MLQTFVGYRNLFTRTSVLSCCHFQSTKAKKRKKFFDPDVFRFVQNSHKLAQNGDLSNDCQDLVSIAKQELTDEHLKCAKHIFKIAKLSQVSLEHNMFASLPRASLFEENSDNSIANIFYSGQSNSKQCLMEELDLTANEQFYWSLIWQYSLYLEDNDLHQSKIGLGKEEVIKELGVSEVLQKIEDGTSFHIDKKELLRRYKAWASYNDKFRRRKNCQKNELLEKNYKSTLRNYCLSFLGQKKLNDITNHRLITAKQFGQPLVFDMRFNKDISKSSEATKQIMNGQAFNKVYPNPFHVVYCNADSFSPLQKRFTDIAVDPELISTVTEKSYLDMDDLLPREKLVYLSPDAKRTMTTFSHEKIYIIGSLVDINCQKNLTKMLAEMEQIQCEKFPLREHLIWRGIAGSEDLSLDVVFRLLVTLKHTNSNWIKALKHVPKRYHMGLSKYGMQCINYDEEICMQFGSRKLKANTQIKTQHEVRSIHSNMFSSYLGR